MSQDLYTSKSELVRMSTQISLQLSEKMMETAKTVTKNYGYDSLQDFIRETLREKLFGDENLSGKKTALASQKALSQSWNSEGEEKAWAHLQKEM